MTFSMQLYHGQINCCQVLQEASDSVAMSVLLLVTPLLILAQLAAWFGYSTQGHPIRKPTLLELPRKRLFSLWWTIMAMCCTDYTSRL